MMAARPAPHPSGAALWCKRCSLGFYGQHCARQHQRFAFTNVFPLGHEPPAWGIARWDYCTGEPPPAGCLPFAADDLITIVPWGSGPAAKHTAADHPGWLVGLSEEGTAGMVPENYVQLQYEGQAPTSAVSGTWKVAQPQPRAEPQPTPQSVLKRAPQPEPEPEPEPRANQQAPPPDGETTEFLPGLYTETYDKRAQWEQRAQEAAKPAPGVGRWQSERPQQARQTSPQPAPPTIDVPPPRPRADKPRSGIRATDSRVMLPAERPAYEHRRGSLGEEQHAEIERRVAEEVSRQLYRVDEEAQKEAIRLLDLHVAQEAEAERLREIGKQLLQEQRAGAGGALSAAASADAAAARAAEISEQFERSRADEVERRRVQMEHQIRVETERRFAEELQRLQVLEHDSAALVQATFRGWQLRKRHGGAFGTQRREYNAATRVQSAWRGLLGRRRATLHREGKGAWECSLDGTLLRRLEARRYRSKEASAAALRGRRQQNARYYLNRRTGLYDALLQSVLELDRQRPLDVPPARFLAGHLDSIASGKELPNATAAHASELPELAPDLRERCEWAFAECGAAVQAAASPAAQTGDKENQEAAAVLLPTADLQRLLYTVSCRPTPDALQAAILAVDPDGRGCFALDGFIEFMRAHSATNADWARRVRVAAGGRHAVWPEPMAYYNSCGVREDLMAALSQLNALRPDTADEALKTLAKELSRRTRTSVQK